MPGVAVPGMQPDQPARVQRGDGAVLVLDGTEPGEDDKDLILLDIRGRAGCHFPDSDLDAQYRIDRLGARTRLTGDDAFGQCFKVELPRGGIDVLGTDAGCPAGVQTLS